MFLQYKVITDLISWGPCFRETPKSILIFLQSLEIEASAWWWWLMMSGAPEKYNEKMICNFYPLLFTFPPEANHSVAEWCRELCREQEADQCCLTARALDLNTTCCQGSSFLVLVPLRCCTLIPFLKLDHMRRMELRWNHWVSVHMVRVKTLGKSSVNCMSVMEWKLEMLHYIPIHGRQLSSTNVIPRSELISCEVKTMTGRVNSYFLRGFFL